MKKIAERYNIFGLEYSQKDLDLDKKYFLNEVDLFEVARFKESSLSDSGSSSFPQPPQAVYTKSGIKSILAVIMHQVGKENLDSVLFEFTKLTSSPNESQKFNFTCFWCHKGAKSIINKDFIDRDLRPLHNMLRDKELSIYNHQGFFSLPVNPNAYASHHNQILKFKYSKKSKLAATKRLLKMVWRKKYSNSAKPLDLEIIADKNWDGELWIRNLPFSDLTYEKFIRESYNKEIEFLEEELDGKEPSSEGNEKGVRYLSQSYACLL